MALLHKAQLVPSKLDALTGWLPGRSWAAGLDTTALTQVGSYRFDDPAGAVGIETLLVRTADGQLLQVPLSYRAAPLESAADALVTTMEHSVLGPRWAYDGCADPVAVQALATAVLTGGQQAELQLDTGAGLERREPTVRVRGTGSAGTAVPAVTTVTGTDSGTATVLDTGDLVLTVRRRLDGADPAVGPQEHALRGSWAGTAGPIVLVTVRRA